MNQDKFKQLQAMYSELKKLEDQRLLIFKTSKFQNGYMKISFISLWKI
jgi:hypothetical protein